MNVSKQQHHEPRVPYLPVTSSGRSGRAPKKINQHCYAVTGSVHWIIASAAFARLLRAL